MDEEKDPETGDLNPETEAPEAPQPEAEASGEAAPPAAAEGGPGARAPKPGAAPPQGEPRRSRKPAMGFLEKVAALSIVLWGLAGVAALGGIVFFLVTFMGKHKII